MKKTSVAVLVGSLSLLSGCENFLDVNTNPNAPQEVAANLYLPPMLHWMVSGQQWDGRYIGQYTQQWAYTSSFISAFDRMGYAKGSDAAAQQWRDVYWSFGQNLVDMMDKAEAEERWDILGVGYILKAWGWQALTDLHGEIIVKEAIDQTKSTFTYDDQEFVYGEVRRLLEEGIKNLERTEGAVDRAYLAQGDKIYNGDREKWLKFAYGLLAMNLNHYGPNKASYDPAAVIAAVDRSFTSNADDALLAYPATFNNDTNFLGRSRGNFVWYRQTEFVVGLMDGTQFGGAVDPRISRMLSPSPDGTYRGVDPMVVGFGAMSVSQRPNNLYGYPGSGGLQQSGRYLFSDKVSMPAMTYAQLQFIKAEAAFHKGDKALALQAYRNGISAHIDFVNARNREDNQSPSQITAAEKQAFLSNPEIVPTNPGALTLTQIMSQKYIAQWAWGHNELWLDMRRYHYTDTGPVSGRQVFPGFEIPTNLYADNAGKPVYRLRPRYNSEYVWNVPALESIGGLAPDYHTKPLWIVQP